jgi:hypothetical protein
MYKYRTSNWDVYIDLRDKSSLKEELVKDFENNPIKEYGNRLTPTSFINKLKET